MRVHRLTWSAYASFILGSALSLGSAWASDSPPEGRGKQERGGRPPGPAAGKNGEKRPSGERALGEEARGENRGGHPEARASSEAEHPPRPEGSADFRGPGPEGSADLRGPAHAWSSTGRRERHAQQQAYREARQELENAERLREDSLSLDNPEERAVAQAKAESLLAEARKKLEAARAELKVPAGEAPRLSPEKEREMRRKLFEREETQEKSRNERAEASRHALEKKFGTDPGPELSRELRRHAWAVARLERIIDLAETSGDTEKAERARGILSRENSLYQERVNALQAAAVARASASAEALDPAAAPPPKLAPAAKAAARKRTEVQP